MARLDLSPPRSWAEAPLEAPLDAVDRPGTVKVVTGCSSFGAITLAKLCEVPPTVTRTVHATGGSSEAPDP